MATVTLLSTPSPCSPINETDVVYTGILAQAVTTGQPCYINSTGQIVLCSSAALVSSIIDGWTTRTALGGETMTLVREATWDFNTLSTANYYFLSPTAGLIDDTPNGFSGSAIGFRVLDRQINENGKNRVRARLGSNY